MFKFFETDIKNLVLIEPMALNDERGFFMETYKQSEFCKAGIDVNFLQDNHSRSSYGVVRGLHFQNPPKPQAKLIRCIAGKIYDVALDIRPQSATFGKWQGFELSAENQKMLFIPEGFAHGFSVLSEAAEITYKVSCEYVHSLDSGIMWNDDQLNIDWKVENPIISKKDTLLQSFSEYKKEYKKNICKDF